MQRSLLTLLGLIFMISSTAFAGGGGSSKSKGPKFDWKSSTMPGVLKQFVDAVTAGHIEQAYKLGGETLRESRSLEEFKADLTEMGLVKVGEVTWNKGIPALPAIKNTPRGYKLSGLFKSADGKSEFPVYLHVEGDMQVEASKRNMKWSAETTWTVLDYRSARSMWDRIGSGEGTILDWILVLFIIGLAIAFIGMILYYVLGLRGSPRELYLMFFTKVTEYSAYGAASVVMVKYLAQDVVYNGQSLGDTDAYLYYGVWALCSTIITITVGSVCDTIGIKKCLLIGAVMLLTARFSMPMSLDIGPVTLLGFLPLAFGFAITGPVLKVGIKRFTTLKSATLGFGLFYTLMNVGFWIGAEIADWFRAEFSDTGTLNFLGFEMLEMTTYQAIIAIGFLINIPDFLAILWMREGAEMTENGFVIHENQGDSAEVVREKLITSTDSRRSKMLRELSYSSGAILLFALFGYFVMYLGEVHTIKIDVIPVGRYFWAFYIVAALFSIGGILYSTSSLIGTLKPGKFFDKVMKSVRDATQGTAKQLSENFSERAFWVYMGMLAILVFVRLTFYLFHVMFPTYAIRVFGADFPVASIFGSLNPAMIVFLVPLIALISTKIRSYTMLLIGTLVSAGSVFLCFMPDTVALAIGDTWFGTWILDYWLEAPEGNRDPFLISLVVFIIVFTIGEAIWSPRLMQFSAEIAPRGKEGAYIALALLPYFLGKMGATIVSEQLTTRYFNAELVEFSSHTTSWLVIGSMAMISPIGLVIFKSAFTNREDQAKEEATAFAEGQLAGKKAE